MSCCHITCYCQYDHIGNDFLYDEEVFDADLFDPEVESDDPAYDISSLRFEIDVAKHCVGRYTSKVATAQSDWQKTKYTTELTNAKQRLAMLCTKLARFLELNPEFK